MSGGGGDSGGQDFDLNLAPIIDCFTVLITYLLVSASFISLSGFDVGVAASGLGAPPPEAAAPKDPPFNLLITLNAAKTISLKLTGGAENLDVAALFEPKQSGWDVEGLEKKLSQLQQKYPKLTEANINAEPTVRYSSLVKVVEKVKKHAKVFLAG